MLERLPCGTPGLDSALNGGYIENSIISVVGGTGTGKSTIAMQFILKGLILNEPVIYLSLDEKPDKLISEAESLGLRQFLDFPKLTDFFHHVSGSDVVDFFTSGLPNILDNLNKDFNRHTRIVLDSITPLLWEVDSPKEQKELLLSSYDLLRMTGTCLQTVEEDIAFGGLKTLVSESTIPLYLSDTILHLQNLPNGGTFGRTIRIVKSRGSSHNSNVLPIYFVYGMGIVVEDRSKPVDTAPNDEIIDRAMFRANNSPPTPDIENLLSQLKIMKGINHTSDYLNTALQVVMEELGI